MTVPNPTTAATAPAKGLGTPICSHCQYDLTGATTSATCPECGKPLVEVLDRVNDARPGYKRYTSESSFLGLPLVSVAYGPDPGEKAGKAVGIIAIGDHATGFVAIGGVARGGICCGGFSIGVVSFGGFAVGLVGANGGVAVGGAIAAGGLALSAYYAIGGLAMGHLGHGGLFYQLW